MRYRESHHCYYMVVGLYRFGGIVDYRMTQARERALRDFWAAQRRANNKVSRLKSKGINIKGSDFDVRVSKDKIYTMPTHAINKAVRDLKKFTSRQTSFKRGYNGSPISSQSYERYLKASEKRNRLVKKEYYAYDNIPYPRGSDTVGERRERIKAPRRSVLRDNVSNTPYVGPPMKPHDFFSERAVNKMAESLGKRSSRKYADKVYRANRKSFRDMAMTLGRDDVLEAGLKLNRRQFNFFFHNLSGIEHLGIPYELKKMSDEGHELAKSIIKGNTSQFEDVVLNDIDYAARVIK